MISIDMYRMEARHQLQCSAETKKKRRCKNKAKGVNGFCRLHQPKRPPPPNRPLPQPPVREVELEKKPAPKPPQLSVKKKPIPTPRQPAYTRSANAFKGFDKVYDLRIPTDVDDPFTYLESRKKIVAQIIHNELLEQKNVKTNATVQIEFSKTTSSGENITTQPYIPSKTHTVLAEPGIRDVVDNLVIDLTNGITNYEREGSGWTFSRLLLFQVGLHKHKPLKGSSFIELPPKVKHTKAVVNVKNKDNKCFMWSVLAGLHPQDVHAERISHYQPFDNELNFDGIDFPVAIKDIPKFERQNTISVNVFGYEQDVYPLYTTKHVYKKHVDLFYITKDTNSHYCYIKNFNRLMYSQNKHKCAKYFCKHCLHAFSSEGLLHKHEPECMIINGMQKIQLPEEGRNRLKFVNQHKGLKCPFIIYADFESITKPIEQAQRDPKAKKSYTDGYQMHIPCGFAYKVVCVDKKYTKHTVLYRGEDCVQRFITALKEEQKYINRIAYKTTRAMIMTKQDEIDYDKATHCHICDEPLNSDRVRDHCHISGKFRGAAHNQCNRDYRYPKTIPVVFHNLRGYDSHLIMQHLGGFDDRITCIANNMEKYISFSLGKLVFIDSLQFMNSSLENLVKNMKQSGLKQFKHTNSEILKKHVNMLTRKGVYPYDYMDSFERFDETQLPPQSAFYSMLYDEHITDDDYKHAQTVWKKLQVRNMGDYHDVYLLTDVLLLADVFENFRETCLKYYKLDPAHYYTAPGLSWDACLRKSKVNLELLTDIDMYLMIEKGIRGGISTISNRYSVANNTYMSSYDPQKESKYIMYLDANNLYGWAMSEYLPVDGFRWLSEDECQKCSVNSIPNESPKGYILEVDLDYPKELHDLHNDYPLAPESIVVEDDVLSAHSKQLREKFKMGSSKTPKLVPNLNDKTKYVVHYRNLKLYLSLGLKLRKIHRVIEFNQEPWMKCYIDFNTSRRREATNDFEKGFFKLMNNSVFGKTMENLRKRVDVKLCNDIEQRNKLVSRPRFKSMKIFNDHLVAIELRKKNLTLNRPIYCGFTILDNSKTLMYDFHYNYIKQKYGPNAKLLFTDTDSLCYEIKTEDAYNDMYDDKQLFDFSDYPADCSFHDVSNKKVIGKFKDETSFTPITEFVGLRSKMYSFKTEEYESKRAKGVKKNVVRKNIVHENYVRTLHDQTQSMVQMKTIRSDHHRIMSYKLNKIGLSCYDDKRFALDNGINTLAYGHHLTEGC